MKYCISKRIIANFLVIGFAGMKFFAWFSKYFLKNFSPHFSTDLYLIIVDWNEVMNFKKIYIKFYQTAAFVP